MKKIITLVGLFLISTTTLFSQTAPDTLWLKTYGGSDYDKTYSVQQTNDGGYILVGYTRSFGAGSADVYILKTDSNGDTLWTKTFGGTGWDDAKCVKQTNDNGYIITGVNESGFCGIWLIKTDHYGNEEWNKKFINSSGAECVQQTNDTGYIVVGKTNSPGMNNYDIYVIKTDSYGDTLWTNTYGGGINRWEEAHSIQQTSDNGYIIAGRKRLVELDEYYAYILKISSDGDSLWSKIYNNNCDNSIAHSIKITSDNGYIISGWSWDNYDSDIYIIKTNSFGDTVWTKSYGGSEDEKAYCINEANNNYLVAGYSRDTQGSKRWYLCKIDDNGDLLWEKIFENVLGQSYSVISNTNRNIIMAGYNEVSYNNDDACMANIIQILSEFSTIDTNGYSPHEVEFMDESYGDIISWDWNFGDNSNSNEQNPVHVYENSGLYTVTLTVTDDYGYTDTETKIDYISVIQGNSVDGYAYLENQSYHNNIKVLFERTVPSSYIDSTFSDSSGYYFLGLPDGIYDIQYSKDNYHPVDVYDEILFSNITLSDITLIGNPTTLNVPAQFDSIQSAIDFAWDGDTVLVQPGTYVENINFWGKNITVGSLFLTTGDTTYITQTIIDGNQNNSVIIFCSGEDSTTFLTGFTITNGYGNSGGGIWCANGPSPTLTNLNITGNTAIHSGGGIFFNISSSSLSNIIISENNAGVSGGGIDCSSSAGLRLTNVTINCNNASTSNGGGIRIYGGQVTLNNVNIIENTAEDRGGGIYCAHSNINLTNVTISGNNASTNNGGGIYFYESDPILINVIVNENASEFGGGIYCDWYSNPLLTNTTIVGNIANYDGGGIHCGGSSTPCLVNTIVSDNTGNYGIYVSSGNPTIWYSDFWNNEGGNFYNCGFWVGVNVTTNANGDSCDAYYNIQMDPLFVDPANNDYNLTASSPCIDAGDLLTTVPNSGGWRVDMGAYEYTGTQIVRSVNGTGEILFGGQVKSKVNVTTQGSLSGIDIIVHPGETHTGAPNSVSRWYEITSTGSGANFDITLSYKDSELNGEVEDNLNIWRWTGSSWDGPKYPSERNTSENWLKVTNQNSFSNWVISDAENEGTLPVELSSFNAIYTVNGSGNEFVTINWVTASETDLHGFNIYRSESDNFNSVGNHINTSIIPGAGNTSQTQYYSFIDDIANPYKNYNYWLETVDFGGISEYHGPVKFIPGDIDGDQEVDLYSSTILYNNYPNPAIQTTTIKYQIKGSIIDQDAIISIYNIKGELVKAIEGTKGKVRLYVSDLPTGIYFYQLKTENYNEVKKMILLR